MLKSEYENMCPVPQGILVVIGGKEDRGQSPEDGGVEIKSDRLEVLKAFTGLMEKENPVVEVITTASSLPEDMIAEYRNVFKMLNIERVGHIHHSERQQVLEDDLSERVNNADAFFFTGGDQLLLTSLYGGTAFLTQLKERYINSRIIIGGTSAGAMALSTPMIYAGSKEVQQLAGEVKITTGLEFLKDVCIDTHFIDRSRFVRMAQVIATNPSCLGIGVEENTAIIVREGSKVEVVGAGLITIIDGFSVSRTNICDFTDAQPMTILDLKVHLLARSSVYGIPLTNPPHK